MAIDPGTRGLRTTVPFGRAVAAAMRERQIGVRQLARQAGISPGHLSRVLREVDGKRATPELIERVREALKFPEAFFVESRRHRIVALLETDPELTDEIEEIVNAACRVRT